MDKFDAGQTLRAVTQVQKQLAGRASWPLWRHGLAGLLLGSIVASLGLPIAGTITVLVLCLASIPLIIEHDRHRDGFFVSGYQAGRTRWVALLILAMSLGTIWTCLHLKNTYGWWASPFVGGILIFFVATFGSLWWQRVYQSDLAGER